MNRYFLKDGLEGVQKFQVATTVEGNLMFCFKSTLDKGVKPSPQYKRQVFLHITDGMEQESIKQSEKRLQYLIDTICWNTKPNG